MTRAEVASSPADEADGELATRMKAIPRIEGGLRLLQRLSRHPRAGEKTRVFYESAVNIGVPAGTLKDRSVTASIEPTKTSGSRPFPVGGNVTAPIVISRVPPEVPEAARKAGVRGVVILEAVIDATGKVRDAKVTKGLGDGIDEAAVAAVRQWKFRPGTRDGVPVDVLFNLTVNISSPKTP